MSDEPAAGGLTHLDERGNARMVDVSAKDRTAREARAACFVRCSADTLARVREGTVPKGDVLAVARVAGIAGAKRTPDLIPLCHPVALTGVDVDLALEADGIRVQATARAQDRTGVEMEALTAAAAAALAIYDMLKAVERGIAICDLRLLAKSGGRSGTWQREDTRGDA
jgi:cyclic pyranopterin phosphate synthase